MSRTPDPWYVRFPDGRVMRANGTAAVRHYLEAGRIPSDSRVRRSPDEEWTALDWTAEFADVTAKLVAARSVPSPSPREAVLPDADGGGEALRPGPMQMQLAGVRGLAEA